ncbi:hypothetical protein KQI41_12155 [Tissierella pigra]|uniref:hypothetical protein n=1 Tax=Tissierella pigra TaxID=2607614 RepID=UPI001C108D40|nr:hypothetical protein [Tissierella pigra]MBU5427169.1 hypothetical protein [Tissierella pigra]
MLEGLLFISKDLLYSLDTIKFTEDERNYVTSILKKVIDVSLVELEQERMTG